MIYERFFCFFYADNKSENIFFFTLVSLDEVGWDVKVGGSFPLNNQIKSTWYVRIDHASKLILVMSSSLIYKNYHLYNWGVGGP